MGLVMFGLIKVLATKVVLLIFSNKECLTWPSKSGVLMLILLINFVPTVNSKASLILKNIFLWLKMCTIDVFFPKLRCSCHVLKIETGRRRKLNIEDRVCDMCGDGYVEDEYHFVLICRFFEELRLKYIPVQYRSQPCIPKVQSSMSSSNSFDIIGLSHYVYYAMKVRESAEFN